MLIHEALQQTEKDIFCQHIRTYLRKMFNHELFSQSLASALPELKDFSLEVVVRYSMPTRHDIFSWESVVHNYGCISIEEPFRILLGCKDGIFRLIFQEEPENKKLTLNRKIDYAFRVFLSILEDRYPKIFQRFF